MSSVKMSNRLLSLDFMRGFIMFLLALEASGLYHHLLGSTATGSVGRSVIMQFFHNSWEGLHFWDLVQPAFMFMAGVAMTYSQISQIKKGASWYQRFQKIIKRCGWLLFWGILKRISDENWLALEALDVTDILTQLAFATFIGFVLFDLRIKHQVLAAFGLLLLTELLYRYWSVPGFDQGYVQGENFGNWVDWILLGQRSNSYVFINWLPTAVHTLAGIVVGKMFLYHKNTLSKLFLSGGLLLLIGYGMDVLRITPIIKPIASSSFVVSSLGYCMLIMAVLYWRIDVRKHRKGLLFFQILGMNSIFIYLLCDIVGRNWLNSYGLMVVHPIFELVGFSQLGILIVASLSVFLLEWSLCYFLYKKKIFFKI